MGRRGGEGGGGGGGGGGERERKLLTFTNNVFTIIKYGACRPL